MLIVLSPSTWAAQKVLFVVDNSQYQAAKPLTNPVNDATDIEAKFNSALYCCCTFFDMINSNHLLKFTKSSHTGFSTHITYMNKSLIS